MVNPQGAPGNARFNKRAQNYIVPAVDPYNRARAPTGADYRDPSTGRLYPIHCEWRDTSENDIWKLVDIAANVAVWFKLADGAGTSETACANYIVDPLGFKAEYTTIQAALDAAPADSVVFVKEGTYTESLSISKAVTIAAFTKSTRNSPNPVIIKPVAAASFTITAVCKFQDVSVSTNGAILCNIATASLDVSFLDCKISGEAAITTLTNTAGGANSSYRIDGCSITAPATGKVFDAQQGNMRFRNCWIEASAANDSTIASGTCHMQYCTSGITVTTSSTGAVLAEYCEFGTTQTPYQDVTWLTTVGTVTSYLYHCKLYSGTATAVSIGVNTIVEICNSVLDSSNTDVTDGAGTINYAGLTFTGTSSNIATTTQTPLPTGPDIVVPGSITVGETEKDNIFTVNGSSITGVIAQHTSGTTDLGGFVSERHSATAGLGAHSLFLRSKGTEGSSTIVADGDVISRLVSCGYDGADFAQCAEIRVEVDGTPGSDDMPGRILMLTSADGGQTPTEALRITSEQFVGINTTAPLDNLHVTGSQRITHTATEDDDHCLELDCNAAGFGDVKALDIDYITGAITSVQDEEAILVNIDESASTGGIVAGYLVLSTTEGSATINGYETGIGINPVVHESGTFEDADQILNLAADVTLALDSGGAGNITLFVLDDDDFTVRHSTTWDEFEIILGTGSSGAGVAPTFKYSTGGAGYTFFSPADGTNGFRNTGAILWDSAALAGWATATSGSYEIIITRTRNTVNTKPIIDELQISSTTEYSWDKNGDVTVKSLVLTDDLVVAHGGTGASTLTGVLTGNGTSAFTASAVTDNTVVMGSTSNLLQDTTITVTDAGEMVNASQPAFLAYLPTSDLNETGDGTGFTIGSTTALTEVYDQNSDFATATFTAPVTGKYFLSTSVLFSGIASETSMEIKMTTSNRDYIGAKFNPGAVKDNANNCNPVFTILADMDATDTAIVRVNVSGGTKTVDIGGAANMQTFFCGNLVC